MSGAKYLSINWGPLMKWYPEVWDFIRQENPLDDPLPPPQGVPCDTSSALISFQLSTSSTTASTVVLESFSSILLQSTLAPPPPLESWPHPRNRRERRILESLGPGLQKALKRAEKVLGPRSAAKWKDEWDGRLWVFLARSQP